MALTTYPGYIVFIQDYNCWVYQKTMPQKWVLTYTSQRFNLNQNNETLS